MSRRSNYRNRFGDKHTRRAYHCLKVTDLPVSVCSCVSGVEGTPGPRVAGLGCLVPSFQGLPAVLHAKEPQPSFNVEAGSTPATSHLEPRATCPRCCRSFLYKTASESHLPRKERPVSGPSHTSELTSAGFQGQDQVGQVVRPI